MTSLTSVLAMLVSLALLMTACGVGSTSDASIGRSDFADAVAERLDADEAQAACITDYSLEAYSPSEQEIIMAEGISGIPQPRWNPWFFAVIGCLTAEASALEDRGGS